MLKITVEIIHVIIYTMKQWTWIFFRSGSTNTQLLVNFILYTLDLECCQTLLGKVRQNPLEDLVKNDWNESRT